MTYTQISLSAVIVAIVFDIYVTRSRVLTHKVFWASYAIVVFFQLLSNGVFTGLGIVKYTDEAILGSQSPAVGAPPMFGDGRIMFAPVEDLGFGFALVVMAISLWMALERRGVDASIVAGPPRVTWFSPRR